MATTLGTLNPFRYRGYVFDEETGLYYLRSRYYNPVWGRFVNADSVLGKPGQLLGHNVFAYCTNSPIIFADDNGKYQFLNLDYANTPISVIFDISPMDALLLENRSKAKQAMMAIEDPYSLKGIYPTEGVVSTSAYSMAKYLWFYNQVKTNGPMDYKVPKNHPNWYSSEVTYYFHFSPVTLEDFGNINYGYVGKSLGIPDELLFAGGGFAAIIGSGDTSGGIQNFFDSERDHYSIRFGIELYNYQWGNE